MPTPYTGPSIVDYLSSTGQASDFNSRSNLASRYGISGYAGTADQNTQLLNSLRNASAPATPGTSPTTAPNTGPTSAPAANPVVNTAPTPTIDVNSILNMIRNGQIDPNQIDSYIGGLANSAHTKSDAHGSILDNASADAQAKQIREQLYGTTFVYGGQNYQYTGGGSVKTSTTLNQSTTTGAGTTATTGAVPGTPAIPAGTPAPTATPTVTPTTAPTTTAPAAPAPVVGAPALPVATAAGGAPAGGVSSYTGPSIVDYLNSTGQASDFASRKNLATSLGISAYTGTAAQNSQMLNTLRSRSGGNNSSTAVAGTIAAAGTTGTGTSPTSSANPEADAIIANATSIAKSFGWIAPDPKNSPLNIATNFFTQGLAAYGLNDIKTHISDVLKQQTDLQNKKSDEAGDINSNPWLTEGERVARLSKLDDKYATKLDILTHQQQLYEADYKTGLDQVQWQVGQAMDAYKMSVQANDKLFSDALTVAEKVMESDAALKKETLASHKPVEVNPGNTLVDPISGKVIYKAPSKAVSELPTAATNDAAVRAGVDLSTFKTYPADVQAFFSQKKDADIEPIKTALTEVATGKKKAKDFIDIMNSGKAVSTDGTGGFGTLSPAVKKFLTEQAKEAEKIAPPPGQDKGFFSRIWDSIF